MGEARRLAAAAPPRAMTTIRTFIAVDMSAQVLDRAADLIERLRASGAAVKWVRRENMHLTLKFLGDVPEQEIAGVCGAVAEAAVSRAPFGIRCRGAGAFPDAQRPRTLWIGVDAGAELLVSLHAAVEQALAPAGFPKEGRRFHPHLTIGRIRGAGRGVRELNRLIQQAAEFDAGEASVKETLVFSSRLGKSGPVYEVLGRAPLGG